MLKKRIAKLEEALKLQNANEHMMYVVQQDQEQNRMVISDLNFNGLIGDGRRLMDKHPNNHFMIFDWINTDLAEGIFR